jgi:hypothetical protein
MGIDWTTIGFALLGVAIARGLSIASKVRERYARLTALDQDNHRIVFKMVLNVFLHPWELLVSAGMVFAAIGTIILCKALKITLTESSSVYLGATAPDLLLRLLKTLIPPSSNEPGPPDNPRLAGNETAERPGEAGDPPPDDAGVAPEPVGVPESPPPHSSPEAGSQGRKKRATKAGPKIGEVT